MPTNSPLGVALIDPRRPCLTDWTARGNLAGLLTHPNELFIDGMIGQMMFSTTAECEICSGELGPAAKYLVDGVETFLCVGDALGAPDNIDIRSVERVEVHVHDRIDFLACLASLGWVWEKKEFNNRYFPNVFQTIPFDDPLQFRYQLLSSKGWC